MRLLSLLTLKMKNIIQVKMINNATLYKNIKQLNNVLSTDTDTIMVAAISYRYCSRVQL